MSWFQQLVGKLKSALGRKGAQDKPAIEAAPPARAATPASPDLAEKVAELATPTAEAEKPEVAETPAADAKPAEAVEAPVVEAPAEAVEETPVATEVTETPAAVVEPEPEEPVVEAPAAVAEEPVAEEPAPEPAPKPVEPTNPALSTLDNEIRAAELQAEGPYGPGSAKPAADGAAPAEDFTVKAKVSSKLFHTEKSPYFTRTKADVWFKTEADAEGAGFKAWDHKKRAAAK